MKLIDKIFFFLSVPKCVGCGERLAISERVLCNECYEKYKNTLNRNCSICAKPLNRCSCTNHHLDSHYIHKMVKVYRYMFSDEILPTNNLLYSLKQDNRKDVVDFLADELCDAIKASVKNPEAFLYTSVPRRRSAIIEYGFDHAEQLSRAVAKRLGGKYIKALKSKAKKAQKSAANRSERLTNAKFKLRSDNLDISNHNVILIDDIVTTGASLGTCAMLLKSAGAKKIIGASIAIAYKDAYIPLEKSDRFFPKK